MLSGEIAAVSVAETAVAETAAAVVVVVERQNRCIIAVYVESSISIPRLCEPFA
jgi:hypothetical protein